MKLTNLKILNISRNDNINYEGIKELKNLEEVIFSSSSDEDEIFPPEF